MSSRRPSSSRRGARRQLRAGTPPQVGPTIGRPPPGRLWHEPGAFSCAGRIPPAPGASRVGAWGGPGVPGRRATRGGRAKPLLGERGYTGSPRHDIPPWDQGRPFRRLALALGQAPRAALRVKRHAPWSPGGTYRVLPCESRRPARTAAGRRRLRTRAYTCPPGSRPRREEAGFQAARLLPARRFDKPDGGVRLVGSARPPGDARRRRKAAARTAREAIQ